MAKALRITLTLMFAGLLTFIAFLVWSFHYGVSAEKTEFSSKAWKNSADIYAHSNDPGCIRGGMAIDILESELLHGKSITEVKSLLGEPALGTNALLSYELGQCSGFGWHNTLLGVSFNSEGEFLSASIVPDFP